MPNEYGNVERFTQHLLKNEQLEELLDMLKMKNGQNLFDLDWSMGILPKWNEFIIRCRNSVKGRHQLQDSSLFIATRRSYYDEQLV